MIGIRKSSKEAVAMEHIPGQVEVWEESVVIPTYGVGKPDPNPMFLDKRV